VLKRRKEMIGSPPKDQKTIEFIAFCANEDMARPDAVSPANVTLFEVRDKDKFSTPDGLNSRSVVDGVILLN
jgi:hypothetical protein